MMPSASAMTCGFFRKLGQVPSICRRRNTAYAVSQGPYRSGTSRQGEPVRARHRIPSKTCRRSLGGRPIFGIGGNSRSSRSHCATVRSPRDIRRSFHHLDQHLGYARTAHPRPNPKVRRSSRSRSRRGSALQPYATRALYVPHASSLPIAQTASMRLATSPRSPRSAPSASTSEISCADRVPVHHKRNRHPGAQSRAGLPRSASAASASRQATSAITFVPPVSWPVRDGCPRVRVGAGHRL